MGLEVRLDLPAESPAGEPVKARLTIHNQTERALTLASPRSAGALNLVVFDEHWNAVSPEAAGKVHVASDTMSLDAGASTTVDLDDLVYVSGTAAWRYGLRPGSYHVLAVVHSAPGGGSAGEAEEVTATSTVQQIRIRE